MRTILWHNTARRNRGGRSEMQWRSGVRGYKIPAIAVSSSSEHFQCRQVFLSGRPKGARTFFVQSSDVEYSCFRPPWSFPES
jgi:hypothetical protein